MEFTIRDIFVRSVTVELNNECNYKIDGEADYYLNGESILRSDKNVNTIDGLLPDTCYRLSVVYKGAESIEQEFTTKHESVLLDVRSFGAKGDGITTDTASIQAAISACPAEGTLHFPAGTYLTGPLFLKSYVNLWIDEGATLLGHPDREIYPLLPGMIPSSDEKSEYNFGTWEGNPLDCYASLITGIETENTDIFGRGEINGNAASSDWWKDPKVRRGAWRPRTVFLERCRNIRMQSLTVGNSPSWTIHPYYCDNLSFLSLKIRNPETSPNTDGLDPESCSDVTILGTDIAVGDDCIAIKSGKYYMAQKHHKETDNITVRNCLLRHGHGSVTVGSECAGGVRNVFVSHCIFDHTDRGLRIKTRRGRGYRSVIENIAFRHITMEDVRMPFTLNMFYFCDPDGHSDYCQSKEALPVDEMTPEIRSVRASHINCTGADVSILCAYGLPEKKIGELSFTDISASFRPAGERKEDVPVMMDGLEPMSGRGIYVRNVNRLILRNIRIEGSVDDRVDMEDTDEPEIGDVRFT